MTTTPPTAHHHVAGRAVDDAAAWFHAVDPRTGEESPTAVPEATGEVVDRACRAAGGAVAGLADDVRRERLLRALADRLDGDLDRVVAVADLESGLGTTRLTGEVGRTSGQLRLFADLVADGAHHDAVIDHAVFDATPPRPDLRRCRVPLGPIGVFGASNFPLAFSVAGGDTASALAAGCPVVVKAHPAHPATSVVVAEHIDAAVADAGLPGGVFSLVHGRTPEVGRALVGHDAISAVGFTGSAAAGQALARVGAERERPIPVFAEMGSCNPVVVTAGAAGERTDAIAEGFVGSMTLGVGQFCTKPGLLFVPVGDAGDRLVDRVVEQLERATLDVLLTPGICEANASTTAEIARLDGVTELARRPQTGEGNRTDAVLLGTDVATLRAEPRLLEENFGPTAIVVRYRDLEELSGLVPTLPGSLTASLFGEAAESAAVTGLVAALADRAGRVVFDGFPTGVAVTHAMQHGGPFPATTDVRFTSVGSRAIERWLRPVVFQDAPDELLPPALRDANPANLRRQVDGRWTGDARPGSG